MIDYEILKQLGTTKERLREIFTAEPYGPEVTDKELIAQRNKDIETRQKWETKLRAKLEEQVAMSLKNYSLYAAVDMAWDASPIRKETVPLIQYAQGKLDLGSAVTILNGSGCGKYVKKDDKGGSFIDLPKFINVECNLVRSVITRRLAAQSNKYANLWPYYAYEPRGTSQVSKLRADALSQVVDIMADNYDYRHHEVQVMRDMMLYGHQIDFVRASWECEKTLLRGGLGIVETIMREGLGWYNPHPSRCYWDNAHPLSSLNTDTGCKWVGYWDIQRFRELKQNTAYFNTDKLRYSEKMWSMYSSYAASYFNTYYDTTIRIPNPNGTTPENVPIPNDPTAQNERKAHIGLYITADEQDQGVLVAQHFEKIIPQAESMGDYNHPVWARFVVCGDGTVVFAEVMPSTPCAVASFNESDNRLVNISLAHEIMPYQDQMTNLQTNLILRIQQELMTFVQLNKDVLSPEDIKTIRAMFVGGHYATTPLVGEVSFSKLIENGIKPSDAFEIKRAIDNGSTQSISDCIRAMTTLIGMMERLLALSPNEQGQPAPREISATEVNEIATTTSSVYSFISDAIDEMRAAKKRIIYEAMMACYQGQIHVPVVNRYARSVAAAAGFAVVDDTQPQSTERTRMTLTGNPQAVFGRVHDFIFTARDGSERRVNTQAANTLVQMLGTTLQIPSVLQSIGRAKLYEIINEIWRMSGGGVDLGLEVEEGQSEDFGQDEIQQVGQMLQQLAQAFEQHIQQQGQANQQFAQAAATQDDLGQMVAQLAKTVEQAVGEVQAIKELPNQTLLKIAESMKYDKTPAEIQRQLEAVAGLQPAVGATAEPLAPVEA